jgi:2-polyprenyl-3-methyl-5-hydroxy-6-metoxy-1,4-benzoquinol methylase
MKLFDGRDRLHGNPERFEVLECNSCGLCAISPRLTPDELSRFYPEDYVSFLRAVEDEKSWLRRWDRETGIRRRCREVIRRAGTSGSILDVGCATGNFLNGMKRRGWTCHGVEPSPQAVKYARERFGLDVLEGLPEQADYPAASFDVITLWDVFEHLPEPGPFLDRSRPWLKKDGWISLTLPNAKAWERALFGKYWAGWDVPRHFNIFTPKTIMRILHEHQFRVSEIFSFTGRHGIMALDVRFMMTDWKIPQQIKDTLLAAVRSLPLRILFHPFYLLAERLNRSSNMTVFARKTG